jgi:hypothetical protein
MPRDSRYDDVLAPIAREDAVRALVSRPPAPTFALEDCYGILGDYVRLWAPHTEAAPVAVYTVALAAIGALIGRGPSWHFGNEHHHARLFVLLIGVSGSGRKGTALNVGAHALLRAVDEDFARARVCSGLSSAEGLIAEVRDPTPPKMSPDGKKIIVHGDDGVTDKRLLVVEGEIAGALEAMAREGNRLSAITRDAWDGKDLRSLVKRDPQRATAPHVVIVGAITAPELRKLLKQTSVLNGLANRFLAVWSTRARLLPESTAPDAAARATMAREIAAKVDRARTIGTVEWSPAAREEWAHVYCTELAVVNDPSDIVRALLERGAPYVCRVAFLLAILDGSKLVELPHLRGALALWRYVADTWRHVYHDGTTRSDLAEKILAALQACGADGLTRTQIRDDVVRSGDVSAERIDAALAELSSAGLAIRSTERTRGRPRERWQHARYVGAEGKEERYQREQSPIDDDLSSLSSLSYLPPRADDEAQHTPHAQHTGPAFDVVPWELYEKDAA